MNSTSSHYVCVGIRHHQEVEPQPMVMSEVMVTLRGWHLALAHAELQALLPTMTVTSTPSKRWYAVEGPMSVEGIERALEPAANVESILSHATIVEWNGSYEGVMDIFQTSLQQDINGTVSTYTWRHGKKIDGCSLSSLSKMCGGALVDFGNNIDLEQADQTFGLCSDAASSCILAGWFVGSTPSAFGAERRQATERPFFKPVSLDPRLARTAINIACGPVSTNIVLDPMTGTGGFIIEASLSKRNGVGIDHNSAMIEGAQSNLKWAHDGEDSPTCVLLRGDATALGTFLPQHYHGHIAGIVLDPPYGRNSQGSYQPLELLEKTLMSAKDVLAKTAGMVLILPIHPMTVFEESGFHHDEIKPLHGTFSEVQRMLSVCGWTIEAMFTERVHKSLTRLVVHAKFVLLN